MKSSKDFLIEAAERALFQSYVFSPTGCLHEQIKPYDSGDDRYEFELAKGKFLAIMYGTESMNDWHQIDADQLCLMYLFASEMV